MTKQQKINLLNQFIKTSQIEQAIENFEEKLSDYRRLAIIQKKRYSVESEFVLIEETLSILKSQLQDLIEQSLKWEELE
ncbi:MAG: hypothetical protein MI810_16365 [Flavobacteriales bacterium]|nr:hypothetical protein [Flavobacteriales bacterium]